MTHNIKPTYIYLLSLLLTLGLISCSDLEESIVTQNIPVNCEAEQPIKIDLLRTSKDNLEIADYFTITSIIKLENDPNHNLAQISEAHYLNGLYYVIDKKFNLFYVYDKKGHFKYQIGKIGRGPGEYLNISDVSFSESKDEIILYSSNSKSLLYYKLNGEFVNSTSLDFYGYNFAKSKKGEYIFYINNNVSDASGYNNILIADAIGDIKNTAFPFSSKRDIFSIGYSGKLNNISTQGVLFSEPFKETIFDYTNGQFCAKYIFDFKENKMPQELLIRQQTFMGGVIEYMYLLPEIIETSRWLHLGFINKKIYEYVVYDKISQTFVKKSDFKITPLQKLFYSPVGIIDDDTFIGKIDPSRFGYFKGQNPEFLSQLAIQDPFLYDGLKDVEETDNHIIIHFKPHFENGETQNDL